MTTSIVRRSLRWFAPTALGVAAAVVTTSVMTTPAATDRTEVAKAATRPRPSRSASADGPRGPDAPTRPWWTGRRAAADAPEAPRPERPADEDLVELGSTPEPPTLREVYDDLLEGRDHYEARVSAEAIDRAWAPAAERHFGDDLDGIARSMASGESPGFSVRDIACKTTMCRVQLDWPSASAAQRNGERIALSPYAENCGVFVLGPSPDAAEQDAAFTQDVYFDCSGRSG